MMRSVVIAGWMIAVAAVSVCILLPGNSPGLRVINSFGINDKVEHFTAFLLLGLPLAVVDLRWRGVFIGGLYLIALGFCLEAAQAFVPSRTPDFADGLADALGVVTGAIWGLVLDRVIRFLTATTAP